MSTSPQSAQSHPQPYAADESLIINSRLREVERQHRQQLSFNRWLTIFTGGLLFATVASNVLIYLQIGTAKTSAESARIAASQAIRSANAAEASLSQNREAVALTLKENQRALERTLGANNKALLLTLSQQERALQETSRLAWVDQRAWLGVNKFSLSSEPEPGKNVWVTYWITNTGKTPALRQLSQSQLLMWSGEPPFTKFSQPKKVKSVSYVLPNEQRQYSTTDPWSVPPTSIKAYTESRSRLYLHAVLRYYDVYGVEHITKVCVYHMFGRSLEEFWHCSSGNEIDNWENIGR